MCGKCQRSNGRTILDRMVLDLEWWEGINGGYFQRSQRRRRERSYVSEHADDVQRLRTLLHRVHLGWRRSQNYSTIADQIFHSIFPSFLCIFFLLKKNYHLLNEKMLFFCYLYFLRSDEAFYLELCQYIIFCVFKRDLQIFLWKRKY